MRDSRLGRAAARPYLWTGGILKRPTRADCKSAGLRLRRFESFSHHQPFPQGKSGFLPSNSMVFTGPLFLNLCVMVLLPSLAFLSIKLSKVIQKSYNARKLEFFFGGGCLVLPIKARPGEANEADGASWRVSGPLRSRRATALPAWRSPSRHRRNWPRASTGCHRQGVSPSPSPTVAGRVTPRHAPALGEIVR